MGNHWEDVRRLSGTVQHKHLKASLILGRIDGEEEAGAWAGVALVKMLPLESRLEADSQRME